MQATYVQLVGGVQVCCLRDIPAGQPVSISYGKLMNDYLLMDYGFLLSEPNPHDRLHFRFDLAMFEIAASEKASVDPAFPCQSCRLQLACMLRMSMSRNEA